MRVKRSRSGSSAFGEDDQVGEGEIRGRPKWKRECAEARPGVGVMQ